MTVAWEVRLGECVEAMRAMPAESVDAVVTDPPYHLGFMGKSWDTMSPLDSEREHERWAAEALRVLKPGGHLVAFGGSRTYHRLASGVEDAGFEVRDQLQWLYGSGFPKSLDVSKAIDKAAGAEREVVGSKLGLPGYHLQPGAQAGAALGQGLNGHTEAERIAASQVTAAATTDAQRWEGWGTALKPAHEPIVLARKPLSGTVAGNVLAHGTGALNIDGARVEGVPARPGNVAPHVNGNGVTHGAMVRDPADYVPPAGRWPANVVLDEGAAAVLDEQSGSLTSGTGAVKRASSAAQLGNTGAAFRQESRPEGMEMLSYGDTGGASRFFYVAKASRAEREAGLDGEPARGGVYAQGQGMGGRTMIDGEWVNTGAERGARANVHPTVKPIDVMRWLVRLVCPEGGLVLDPFSGSGSTGIAAVLEGRRYLGLEREAEYVAIAEARIGWWAAAEPGFTTPQAMRVASLHEKARAGGQFTFWDDDEDEA